VLPRAGGDGRGEPVPPGPPPQNADFVKLIFPQVCPQTVPVMVFPLTVRVTFTQSTGAFWAHTWKARG
jgi:hypothetical protein